eukprot:TRINITY_DN1363_c11_g1_i1.p1 TRINITY_DN1363_c11_g1~~TRINITY_DN1363_c11_g1_i1.p1  ORF type:complete len:513 (+),score=44.31 TRINITY_DN1363_c11_g1_i1:40-1578(+)
MTAHRLLRLSLIGGATSLSAAVADDQLFYGNGKRCLRAGWVGIHLIYQYKINWTPENAGDIHTLVARHITQMLNKNGGMYIKFGQTLTTMGHVLPREYMDELRVLFSDTKTYPSEDIVSVIEEELKVPISEIFTDFNMEPVASASIAQVHKATLKDGTEVAVKVQKPLIHHQHRIDFFMLYVLLFCVEKSFNIPCLWSYDFAVERYVSELDFTTEASNSEKCSRLMRTYSSRVYVPEVKVSTKRVLLTEWVPDTVTIDDVEGLKKMNVHQKDIMELAVGLFAHQIFETGHVHCDPHPGNLLVRKKGKTSELVLIDHGLYVTLPDELRIDYANFWSSMLVADSANLKAICTKWGVSDPDFFASVTQQRPFKSSRGAGQMLKKVKAPSSEELARMHLKIKSKLTTILDETASFPRELMFVGRALNYLRSHNWCHGSIVNRVQILGSRAARGLPVWQYYKFQSAFMFFRLLEYLKTNFSSLWVTFIHVMPTGALSNFLVSFSSAIDSSPTIMSDL